MRLRSTDVAMRPIGETVMILDLVTNTYHSVGGSGVFLLEHLNEDVTEDDLVDALVGTFDVERELASRDVRVFLDELGRNGLLEP